MGKIEEKLFDLEEYLRRNDDSADSSAYLTIVGIANEVSKLESENAKLRSMRDRWQENDADLREENAKLRNLVAHLMFVKPNDVNAILYKGKLLRFDDLLAEVGMRWESKVEQ